MDILTVSQLNRYLAYKLKEDPRLKGIFLKGEISNFRDAGHYYFTIKDNESLIKAVMFRSNTSMLKFRPENGMSVIAMGSVSVFERDGVYQLYVTDMIPDGQGNQHIEFEKLKKELAAEGLFDKEHKLPLPAFPEKIGVVTSSKGAALQDIINITSRRYPLGELCVYHSLVQGEGASASLCAALSLAECDGCDVIILGRGGGSYEDLVAFNDKQLAYYIYHLSVPVISAVGHETDFTIADFVADMRAPTPSAAAELAVPSIEDIMKRIDSAQMRLTNSFELFTRRLDEKTSQLTSRLQRVSPENVLVKNLSELEILRNRLENAYRGMLDKNEMAFADKISRLEALNPLEVLKRGYSVVYDGDDKIIGKASELTPGDNIKIGFAEGYAYATILKTEK